MFYDCLRCGYATRYDKEKVPDFKCICQGMTEEQASYLKSLHNQHYAALREIKNLKWKAYERTSNDVQ